MKEEQKNPNAVELGKLGGRKLAEERGPEYYARIQAMRKTKAGGRPPNPPKAEYIGVLKIGDIEIQCAVLADGTRVLPRIGFLRAIGRRGKAKGGRKYDQESEVPVFLTASNLKSFIPSTLLENSTPIPFTQPPKNTVAMGYRAELLPQVCNVFLDAKDAGVLQPNQLHIAEKCKILSRGFAVVGLTALIDEATGYQDVRAREALAKILDQFLAKEQSKWAKRFPNDYYKEMFRLHGWSYYPFSVKRPRIVGKLTVDLVYDRLAPGVRRELEKLNPKNSRGRRRSKHHQWLTVDIGHPKLQEHLTSLVTLMKASTDWQEFKTLLKRALPKYPNMPLLERSVQEEGKDG